MDEAKNAWSQLLTESDEQYRAFCLYRDGLLPRDCRRTYREFAGKPEASQASGTFNRWYKSFQWKTRCEAYDVTRSTEEIKAKARPTPATETPEQAAARRQREYELAEERARLKAENITRKAADIREQAREAGIKLSVKEANKQAFCGAFAIMLEKGIQLVRLPAVEQKSQDGKLIIKPARVQDVKAGGYLIEKSMDGMARLGMIDLLNPEAQQSSKASDRIDEILDALREPSEDGKDKGEDPPKDPEPDA